MPRSSDSTSGPGNPPKPTRFQKGQSGNPGGRPKRPVEFPPYESVLGQLVRIEGEDKRAQQVTVEMAFLLQLTRRGMQDDMIANQQVLKFIEKTRSADKPGAEDDITYISIIGGPNYPIVNPTLSRLEMVRKLRADSASPYILIEPWLVEAALARFGERQLTAEEQREVWGSTRTPHKVKWPVWWTEQRGTGRRRPKAPLIGEDGSYPPCVVPKRVDE
jgi:hypothetical protein